MRGSTVMFIGSFVLIPIVVFTPHEHLLKVAIPYVAIEFAIALYVTYRNDKKK